MPRAPGLKAAKPAGKTHWLARAYRLRAPSGRGMAQIDIQLTPRSDGSVAVSAQLPAGRGKHLAPGDAVSAVRRDVARLMSMFEAHGRPLVDPVTLVEVGRQLRDVFLAPLSGLAKALNANLPYRLVFTSQDPDCLNLPWELLPGAAGRFLVEDARWAIRRSTRGELPVASLPLAAPPLRILFSACAPIDQVGLDYEKEEEAILRIAHRLGGQVHLEICEAGTFDELRERIVEYRPHIVHLSGHGIVLQGIGSFAFEDERGHTDSREARDMAAQLFAGQGVRLVFVNGCQSAQNAVAGICQALTAEGHVPLALGWGASINDDHATEFARVFLHEVAAGQPVDHAASAARAAMLARGRVKQGVVEVLDASFTLPQLHAADDAELLIDPRLPADPPARPGVAYSLLGDNIRGLKEGFVGRRRQLQRTRPVLRSGEKNIVLLTGIGGAGKSTLATRLANRFQHEGYRVVALQARREQAEQFCLHLVTELATACQRLGREADEKVLLDGQRPVENRLRLAVEILNEAKILLVLDNLESLMPPPPAAPAWERDDVRALFAAITSRLTGEGRALLTCRYLPAGFDPNAPNLLHEPMQDFPEADFLKYLRRHPHVAERMDRGELSQELVATFHRKLGATPRFVEQASAILSTLDADRLAEQLEALAEPAAGTVGDDLWQLQQKHFRDLFLPQLYASLSASYRRALSRFALVREPLPIDGLAGVAGLELSDAQEFVRRCLGLSLLQRFGELNETELFAVYSLQREYFTAPERLSGEERRSANHSASVFFRDCYEKNREQELRLGIVAGLLASLDHATNASDFDGQVWAATKLAGMLIRRAEYDAALALAEPLLTLNRHPNLLQVASSCAFNTGDWRKARELVEEEQSLRQASGDRNGEAATWHQLGTIDLSEGKYDKAREKFAKALALEQIAGDREGEAATLHQLGHVDLHQGNYAAAREKLSKSLAARQSIRDLTGEAAAWHALATIELHEGNADEARTNFGKSLAINQAIGGRAGEAKTWLNLATMDVDEGNIVAGREKFGKAMEIHQAIGDRAGEAAAWHNLASTDMEEGDFAAAHGKFNKSLAIMQSIGYRAGEAAAFFQIGLIAWKLGRRDAGVRLVALCFGLDKAMGSAGLAQSSQGLVEMVAALGINEVKFDSLIREVLTHYKRDRGAELVRQAFAPET